MKQHNTTVLKTSLSHRMQSPLGIACLLCTAMPALAVTVTNTNDSGLGSLRDAIASTNTGGTINFQIPTSDPNFTGAVFNIEPLTPLPAVQLSSIVIDATTQTTFTGNTNTGGPEIVLSGQLAGAGASGLRLNGSYATVRGLVINAFSTNGIDITSSYNTVAGCFIGTNPTAVSATPNGENGIRIFNGPSANSNLIGGVVLADRNVISGNDVDGVVIGGANSSNVPTANTVQGNYIGVNRNGLGAIPNQRFGVNISYAASNTIGGTVSAARNVISGNGDTGVTVFSTSSSPSLNGYNKIQGNYIGVNSTGTASIQNEDGIVIEGASNTTIGGNVSGARNTISGNQYSGIYITGVQSKSTSVQGNRIGTNPGGTAALTNGFYGIEVLNGSQSTEIGGSVTATRNIISGNTLAGISIRGSLFYNRVSNNYIGVDINGTTAIPNADGIAISAGGHAAIGPTRNIISGNTRDGINVGGTGGCEVGNNYIGLNAGGSLAIGNGRNGVSVEGATSATIGMPLGQNIISGNAFDGIAKSSTGSVLIYGNRIGLTASGAQMGNGDDGIDCSLADTGSQSYTSIGSNAFSEQNIIAYNGNDGIRVSGAVAKVNIRANLIYLNDGLGINLVKSGEGTNTVTLNDAGDVDTGPNTLLNFPVIQNVSVSGSAPNITLTVTGYWPTTVNIPAQLDIFRSSQADSSGHGEGEVYLGSTDATGVSGPGSINFYYQTVLDANYAGQFITVTATNDDSGTSEFSQVVAIPTLPSPFRLSPVQEDEPSQ